MKEFVFTFFSVLSMIVYSQEYKKIDTKEFIKDFKLIVQKLNNDNFSMSFKKEIFKDKSSNEIALSSRGIIYHGKGLEYCSISDGIKVIQNEKINLLIDSAERLVQLSAVDTNYNPATSVLNFKEEALKPFQIFKSANSGYTTFKLIPTNLMEGTIEMFVDSKTNHIYKIIVTYPKANYFSENVEDESEEEPYAVIVYEQIKSLSDQEKKDLFNLSSIVVPAQKGRYQLTETFNEYELYDSRYSTNQ